jgi:aminopeptidase-like protein
MRQPTDGHDEAGQRMYALIEELFPICRSITGDGIRETLRRLSCQIPLNIVEVPSGTHVFDWTVPNEWNIRDAWIANSRGERVVDFAASNLHVVNYSVPVRQRMSLADLRPHLHSLPDHPDWIPYRTSYYKESWGFCLPHRTLESLPDDLYDVCIDSSLAPGSLTYGEYVVRGRSEQEILLSCHCCHPSLANDNLSAIAVAVELARRLSVMSGELEYTYRFLFIPGTIGSITWLAQNRDAASRVRYGLVLSCLGDEGSLTYKRSRRGDTLVDRAAEHVLGRRGDTQRIRNFVPYGYDERQYCSPGFNLAVGCLTRTPNGEFAEYHTSADGLGFVQPTLLSDSLTACECIIEVLEHDDTCINLSPMCEPQLGRRGLYRATGGTELREYEMALLWVLSYSDGNSTLLDIAEQAGIDFHVVRTAAADLARCDLLRSASSRGSTVHQIVTEQGLRSPAAVAGGVA